MISYQPPFILLYRVFLLGFILFHFPNQICAQNIELINLRNKGEYNQLVNEVKQQIPNAQTDLEKFYLYDLLAEGHLQLNYLPDHLNAIKQARKHNPNKKITDALYHAQLANYYHYMLMTDSSVFNSMIAMDSLKKNLKYADSVTVCRIYAYYGNCNRNLGESWLNKKIYKDVSNMVERHNMIRSFLDTSLLYCTDNYWKFDVLQKIATAYTGAVGLIRKAPRDTINDWGYRISNDFYRQALVLTNSPLRKARIYSLMALSDYYMYDYSRADSLYQVSYDYLTQNDTVLYLYAYLANQKWWCWSLDEWHEVSGSFAPLVRSTNIYEESVEYWNKYYHINASEVKGYHDGYGMRVQNKLSINYFRLFNETGDSSYIEKSFLAADKSKYPTNPFNNTTLKELQSKLDSNSAFLHLVGTRLPERSYYFVITKEGVDFIDQRFKTARLDPKHEGRLYQFDDINKFKRTSYQFYKYCFEKADSILTEKNIQNVIISNSDRSSMLNFDLLISDTSATSWKEQPYLFHNYNFSYALNGSGYVQSYELKESQGNNVGITIGNYSKDVQLGFSEELVDYLSNKYQSETADLGTNLKNNSIGILLAHGRGSLFDQDGKIKLSEKDVFSSLDVFKETIDNELFIVTACNSNKSRQWDSEGSTANFAKSFRYSGVASVVTTSWEIDDKTNAYLMKKFINYLSDGLDKKEALKKAKKDYWLKAKQDEEFKPFYWSPYILTGNTGSVLIVQKQSTRWLWVLVIPMLFIAIRYLRK